MSATFLDLLDSGLCTGGCLMAVPKSRCDCHCGGWLHSTLVVHLQRRDAGWVEFPGFEDIDILRKGKRIRAIDPEHHAGGWWGRRVA